MYNNTHLGGLFLSNVFDVPFVLQILGFLASTFGWTLKRNQIGILVASNLL